MRAFAILIIVLSGCGPKSPGDAAVSAPDVNAMWKEYSTSLNEGDADRWIALWSEDGVQLPPDEPPVVGKKRIGDRIRAGLDRFKFDMAITNEEVRTSGDLAFARGHYRATLTPRQGGKQIFIDGKYMTILVRQTDGSWKIHRDIFNSNVPPGK
jgi:uncharacterized protein (TIGR02246 family)